jgi:pyruvate kinase
MVHGVHTTLIDVPMSLENAIEMATNSLLRMKALKAGDLIVLAAGYPLGKPGQTNMVQVLTI